MKNSIKGGPGNIYPPIKILAQFPFHIQLQFENADLGSCFVVVNDFWGSCSSVISPQKLTANQKEQLFNVMQKRSTLARTGTAPRSTPNN